MRRAQRTPAERLAALMAGQVDTYEAKREAMAAWEAGQGTYFDVIDDCGQTVHVEAFQLAAGGHVVVAWDDDGNITCGGL